MSAIGIARHVALDRDAAPAWPITACECRRRLALAGVTVVTATAQPSWLNRRAVAAPMPQAAPLMRTERAWVNIHEARALALLISGCGGRVPGPVERNPGARGRAYDRKLQSRVMTYELHYWPTIQGRGEFVRLALEAAGGPYIDVARGAEDSGQGLPAMLRYLQDVRVTHPPFAPPFLKDGEVLVGQTAAILQYLAPQLKLVARSEQARVWTQQIQLTIADMVTEAHDTHHPVGGGLYYEDQKPEALRRAKEFCSARMPKFLQWFESIVVRNPAGSRHLVGGKLSYADLSLFQLVEGLRYAFPKAAQKALANTPGIMRLHDRIAALPRVAAYLRSERRIPFNEQGIFRCYPELDIQ